MGFGTRYGMMWGAEYYTSLSLPLFYAIATSSRSLKVVFGAAPLSGSTSRAGDALSTAVWKVEQKDGTILPIAYANMVSADVVQLNLILPFTYPQICTVSCPNLLDSTGIYNPEPTSASFLGMPSVASVPDIGDSFDIANVPSGVTSLDGSLKVGSSGDYVMQSGAELVKKLLWRRLTTRTGAFRHLPTYGTGIPLQQPVRPQEIVQIKRNIDAQMALEPEVEKASSTVTIDSSGVLAIAVTVKLRGVVDPITVPVTGSGTAF